MGGVMWDISRLVGGRWEVGLGYIGNGMKGKDIVVEV